MQPAEPSKSIGAIHLGAFRVIEPIGMGGSSTVYLGDRRKDFSQRVAIKVMQVLAEPEGLEGQALSSLDHPNIVRLLDQGISADNHRYLVMEYVDGVSIDRFCDSMRLSIIARVRLVLKVMAAVSYAHRHLIVHADLKPSNILVDSGGEPKLLDFGIASTLGEDTTSSRPFFSPAFASPEQQSGLAVTASTDVFGLGVLLRLLLTGNAKENQGRHDASGSLKRSDKPEWKRLAEARSMTVSELRHAISPDLEAILERSLQDEPASRYPSVDAFSADLQAYLEDRPVSALPATRAKRLSKWMVRHRIAAASAAVVLAAVTISAVGITVQSARAEYQRSVAEARLRELVRLTSTLDGELYESIKGLPQSDEAKDTLLKAAAHTMDQLYATDPENGTLALEIAREYAKLARLEAESAVATPSDRKQALAGLDRAIALMEQRRSSVARGELEELRALRTRLVQ